MPNASMENRSSIGQKIDLFKGGGEMGALIRAYSWYDHPMGDPEGWPQSLKIGIRMILDSGYPMFIWWSDELYMFHNDAYLPALGKKHPEALGAKAPEMWSEIWDQIGQVTENILRQGQQFNAEDLLLLLDRKGFAEETYWTFSYSPMPHDDGSVGGVFCACSEVSKKVIGQRRLKSLKDVADTSVQRYNAEAACHNTCDVLSENAYDIPFGLIYLLRENENKAFLAGLTSNVDSKIAPSLVDLTDSESQSEKLFAKVLQNQQKEIINKRDIENLLGEISPAPWEEAIVQAVVIPIVKPGKAQVSGFFVLGISPKLEYDADYQNFHELLAGQLATAIASAEILEEEHKRIEALAEIDKAKTVFFSNISHEFRTPLTLMLGPLNDMLNNDLAQPVKVQIERVQRNGQRMLKLVNTLLEFSRMEAGRVQARFQSVDLSQLTIELSSVFRSAIENAGLRLHVDCPPLPEAVYVDPRMWERIIFNLLSNALKFTFEGEITVRLSSTEHAVMLNVEDTGTGIPAEELPHLFSRFHRIEGARSRTHEGSGIGLAMVAELVKLHGGDVAVESAPDQGTVFSVMLPLGKAHLPAAQLAAPGLEKDPQLHQAYTAEEYLDWLDQQDLDQLSEPALPKIEREDSVENADAIARVLLVDDNADMRSYLTHILSADYEVMTASNGSEAWNIISKVRPDLVVSDVMMPVMDGLALLNKIRSEEQTRTIPVILLSARAGEEAQVEGIQAGADDYLTKPFSTKELKARIKTNLKLSQLHQELNLKEQYARSEAERQQAKLLELFSQAPVAIGVLKGPQHITEAVNPAICEFWGRSADELLGKPLFDVLSEVRGQGFEEMLDGVFKSGKPYVGNEVPARVKRNNKEEGVYFNFVYHPWRDEGKVIGVIIVATEVTEQVKGRKALEAKHEELLKINADLDNFIHMASHDLKSPIANIEGLMEVLNSFLSPETIDFPQVEKIMSIVNSSIERFKNTIADLAEVARLQREENTDEDWLDLEEVIEEVRLDLDAAIQEADARLDIDVSACEKLRFSSKNLRSIVYNLLSNAIKYRSPDRKLHIKLQCKEVGGALRLSVSDNGLGMQPRDQKQLFTMFKRFHHHVDGTGVGLSIVKKIMDNAGGRVEVESEVGRGSTFRIYFKL
ncbi:ATP-binding protein [Catalinimonas niigatensis]|uniref:ATP-binding protein n=1 Tax=Catalinimonas niigatensis TaxID=1397264 RepID=UPI002666B833|nr:ATP-binding protein [Catalinimonas niigatensis]WPP53529.1 ATP-binding protein [Catalinimonas niigatensis]